MKRAKGATRGKTDDSRRTRSRGIPGTACGYRRKMTAMVDLRSSSHQVFLKGRDAGGTDASEPTMHPRKRVERFISAKRLRLGAVDQSPLLRAFNPAETDTLRVSVCKTSMVSSSRRRRGQGSKQAGRKKRIQCGDRPSRCRHPKARRV